MASTLREVPHCGLWKIVTGNFSAIGPSSLLRQPAVQREALIGERGRPAVDGRHFMMEIGREHDQAVAGRVDVDTLLAARVVAILDHGVVYAQMAAGET